MCDAIRLFYQDLVKKHLMSAVRDEVDELKEKIKDLTATISNLSDETSRLKAENKELRSKLPPDVAAQVQSKVNHSPPKVCFFIITPLPRPGAPYQIRASPKYCHGATPKC